ncbi:hypothetical protein EAOG_05076 [Escherichia coli R527]|nr:hypothetical protein EAOG_05076 [Escherichia coli R527]
MPHSNEIFAFSRWCDDECEGSQRVAYSNKFFDAVWF